MRKTCTTFAFQRLSFKKTLIICTALSFMQVQVSFLLRRIISVFKSYFVKSLNKFRRGFVKIKVVNTES